MIGDGADVGADENGYGDRSDAAVGIDIGAVAVAAVSWTWAWKAIGTTRKWREFAVDKAKRRIVLTIAYY